MKCFTYKSHSVLYDAVLSISLEHNNDIAIEHVTGEKVTFDQLIKKIDLCAYNLHSLGIVSGQCVAVSLQNSIEYISLIIACAKIGISYVPILESFSKEYATLALKKINPVALITDSSRNTKGLKIENIFLKRLFEDTDNGELEKPPIIYSGNFRMLWSSGSTGFPKIIIWNQENFVLERLRWIRNIKITPKDIVFCRHTLDVAHATDLHVFTSLLSGAKLVLCSGKEHTIELIELIDKFKPTVMSALPSHYKCFADEIVGKNVSALRSLRMPFCGGSYVNIDLLMYVYKRTGLKLRQLYGSTDFGLAMVNYYSEDNLDLGMTVLKGVNAQIIELPGLEESSGELVLFSPFTSDGYLKNDPENAKSFKNGFYYTGDIATIRENGTYIIQGRVSDLIITPEGPRFVPELDSILSDNTKKISVFTMIDASKKNNILIAIHSTSNEGNRITINKIESLLSLWKVTYTIFTLDDIPLTSVGKIDKPKIFARQINF
ncbi:acyl--CoA ligase (plasmid) [Rahnella aquatilis]|nr:acyl--CoA ligase [Rahnella aquatilis]